MRLPDRYQAVGLGALGVAIPFGIHTLLVGKTGVAPTGWFFEILPGFGLGTVMLLGQGLVATAAVTLPVDRWIKVSLGVVWALLFLSLLLVVPMALYAGAEGLTISEAVDDLMASGVAGALKIGWYFLVVFSSEGVVPPLLIASALSQKHLREAEASQVAVALAEKAEKIRGSRRGTAKDAILVALGMGESTVKDIAEDHNQKESTIRQAMVALERTGVVQRVALSNPVVFQLTAETEAN